MSNIISRIVAFFASKYMGCDEFGNKYYESHNAVRTFGRKKRWVIYKGEVESSKVTPLWFSWLHHQSEKAPTGDEKRFFWEKDYVPNLTGTKYAYYPPGHILSGKAMRSKATGDYQAWRPKE